MVTETEDLSNTLRRRTLLSLSRDILVAMIQGSTVVPLESDVERSVRIAEKLLHDVAKSPFVTDGPAP